MSEALQRPVLSHRTTPTPIAGVEQLELSTQHIEKLSRSRLAKWKLLDKKFLQQKFTRDSICTLEEYSKKTDSPYLRHSMPVVIQKGILTKADFQHRIIAPHNVNTAQFVRILFADDALSKRIAFLIDHKILTRESLWYFFASRRNAHISEVLLETEQGRVEWLVRSGVISSTRMNVICRGVDAIESEALWRDLAFQSTKSNRYPVDIKAQHPTVIKLRGQEHVNELSRQMSAILDGEPPSEVMDSFKKVFDAYLVQTKLYKKLKKHDTENREKRILARKANIKLVNNHQIAELKSEHWGGTKLTLTPDLNNRYLDIYARYDAHGSMDPLQLAIIARAAWWYIMSGRSRLFTGVRILPYKTSRSTRLYEIPWVAHAACPGSKVLEVQGMDFVNSNIGANRMYLTHSDTTDSSLVKSIPIVGLGAYRNSVKLPYSHPFVVLAADFDTEDRYRNVNVTEVNRQRYLDTAGDIPALINETLRALIACENAEIDRAIKAKKGMLP